MLFDQNLNSWLNSLWLNEPIVTRLFNSNCMEKEAIFNSLSAVYWNIYLQNGSFLTIYDIEII